MTTPIYQVMPALSANELTERHRILAEGAEIFLGGGPFSKARAEHAWLPHGQGGHA
jgi:hypothetical protein